MRTVPGRLAPHERRLAALMRAPHQRLAGAVVLGLAAVAALALSSAAAANGKRSARAVIARTITASDTAHLHLVRANGSVLHEAGRATGGLPGQVSAQLEIGATVSGTVTIHTSQGEVKAKGRGSLRTDHYPWEGFTGDATVTRGTGRYRHARGTFKLYGLFNRRTDAIVAHTRGRIHY